jgi:hypothetical protein
MHSNAFMSNMIYVKKSVEVIIILKSVGGTVSAKIETCRTILLHTVAHVNLIDLNTTRKNDQNWMTGSLLAIRGRLFLIGLEVLSSINGA